MKNQQPIQLSIFASGSGTNAENIVNYFGSHPQIRVNHIFCNKEGALVLQRAKRLNIQSTLFTKDDAQNGTLLAKLKAMTTDFIILAGYLWLVPKILTDHYPNKIINIHPALLPKYGGKGMYGGHVHKAVIENKDRFSGITIHLVNERYDEGQVLFQEKVQIENGDTPDTLADKIHLLEQEHYPKEIEKYIMSFS